MIGGKRIQSVLVIVLLCFNIAAVCADKYHISISTSGTTGTGRVAEVCLAAYSELGDFELTFCPLPSFTSSFQAGMEDNFYMMNHNRAGRSDSGKLCELALRYSKGTNVDGWHVDRVLISDRNTGENFVWSIDKLLRMKQLVIIANCTNDASTFIDVS